MGSDEPSNYFAVEGSLESLLIIEQTCSVCRILGRCFTNYW